MLGYRTGSSSDRVKSGRIARAPPTGRAPQRGYPAGDPLCRRSNMVTQLHHVNVTVPAELEAATKEFYGSVLGLRQVPKPSASRPSGAWYQIGATQLHLSVADETDNSSSSRHVCFMVDDLDATEKRFREAGVEIIPDARPIPGSKRFYVRDPGGNQLEIVQASV
jgi:catechol 2,3-dioxygenase-like lactoylglutathione lyase family enzyme